jgi:hypothetical protein
MITMSQICDKLREAIQNSPKSRYRLCKDAQIEQSQLSRLMDGTRGLSIDTIEKLVPVLGFEIVLRKKTEKRKKV